MNDFDIFCTKCGLVLQPNFVKAINTGEVKLDHFAVVNPCPCGSNELAIVRAGDFKEERQALSEKAGR